MLTVLSVIFGLVGVVALLSAAIIWTVKLGIAIPLPGDILSSQRIYASSSRFFQWPTKRS